MRCCKKSRLPPEKHIVIVGAGFAGIKLAEEFMKFETVHFTLINLRSEFNQNVAGCRAGIQEGTILYSLYHVIWLLCGYFCGGCGDNSKIRSDKIS